MEHKTFMRKKLLHGMCDTKLKIYKIVFLFRFRLECVSLNFFTICKHNCCQSSVYNGCNYCNALQKCTNNFALVHVMTSIFYINIKFNWFNQLMNVYVKCYPSSEFDFEKLAFISVSAINFKKFDRWDNIKNSRGAQQ